MGMRMSGELTADVGHLDFFQRRRVVAADFGVTVFAGGPDFADCGGEFLIAGAAAPLTWRGSAPAIVRSTLLVAQVTWRSSWPAGSVALAASSAQIFPSRCWSALELRLPT